MNILIDIGHPAHVHYYRNLATELEGKGHKLFWIVKDIPVAKRLLDSYGIKYTLFPGKSDGIVGKVFRQIQYDSLLWQFCRRSKVGLAIGTSVSVPHVSAISSVKSIIFDDDDDEVQPLVTRFVTPLADTLLSPDSLRGKRRRKDTIYYPGFHELAYLHPNRFNPDPSVLNEAGISIGEKFFIMRFNVFKAHHDVGVRGLSSGQKLSLINKLKQYGKVFITTERETDPELKRYQLPVPPEKIHSLMAYATMFLGDSQTMTSEAAVLGIPSLRCNSFAGKIAYLEEQEHKYGLTYGFTPDKFDDLLIKLDELLAMPDLKTEWQRRRNKMLEEKIDVTAFWTWFVHNYPESIKIIDETPDYQLNFR